ncbi:MULTISPECIES: phosphoribosylglycinamide formyltransferase [unclassified Vibrio]|uniref:Phosphoribosylglycinamide formyltransferase n=1 Tax=Vibrio sp. HB236076 TaxID=3232307 RepID=A0AB39HD82_9VIBR|nr:phosphoribosylglycinamide formyltransferase [Vibrio sp. HB161653]MDP5254829.1 phosphoribosylglycinamide formyltransferase [Vibrio sp. HB161653]
MTSPSTSNNIVVLISGSGSNLQAIIDACESGYINGQISAVIANKGDAFGLTRAERHGIASVHLDHNDYQERAHYDQALIATIDQYQPDAVILAGFMRILTKDFVQHYQGKLLNIHPSLLPKYPGLHTHQRAIDNQDKEHGTSVHFVTEELDGGPVILQAKVPVYAEDTAEQLAARVLHQEHKIYPLVTQWLLSGRLSMKDNQAWLDGQCLGPHGYAAEQD